MFGQLRIISFFFFNDTATTEIYTLSLHDALPICEAVRRSPARDEPAARSGAPDVRSRATCQERTRPRQPRSEEHTSELQSQSNLVCRLLLEKKKTMLQTRLPLHAHTAFAPLLT